MTFLSGWGYKHKKIASYIPTSDVSPQSHNLYKISEHNMNS